VRKLILVISLLTSGMLSFGQTNQVEYLEAKRLFNNGQYLSAKAAFGSLTENEVFGKYASFYFGLSAFKLADYDLSRDMFLQIRSQYPAWEQNKEVLYWLSLTYWESGDYIQALDASRQLTELSGSSSVEEQMIMKYLSSEQTASLKLLYNEYKDNRWIASILTAKLIAMPYESRDFVLINQLVDDWGFDLYDMDPNALPQLKKDQYNVAVLLPFLFDGFDNTNLIEQNDLIMDMYQGMLLASEELKAEGKKINIFPYDTKRRAQFTESILTTPGFENHDLIIGPLYIQPNNIVRKYAEEKQVNHFNPISSHIKVIGDSPFSFMTRPGYETIANQMAEYALANRRNNYAMVFYEENERDSLIAATFSKRLEANSVEVIWHMPITKDNARNLIDTLSAQYEYYLRKSEADSISKLPGRFVHDRKVKRSELRKLDRDSTFYLPLTYDEDQKPIVYYENRFHMEPDSIGTILASTRSNLFANNLISAVASRSDSIKLLGFGEWLDFTMMSYSQLDRLGIALSDPDYMNMYSEDYDSLTEKFIIRFKTQPSINHIRGYETMKYLGNMLFDYGKYFQKGLRSGDFSAGSVFEGFKYGPFNDNQIVPIIQFKNSRLEVVNRELYED